MTPRLRLGPLAIAFVLLLAACGDGTQGRASRATAAGTSVTAAGNTAAQPTSTTTTPPEAPTTPTTASTTTPSREGVTFTTADGLMLEGTLFAGGNDAVVLGAMGRSEMETWFAFAEVLAAEGFTAFAYNMRGHGGSDGEPLPYRVDIDAQAAVDFIRQRGAQRVFFFGASVNGVGAIAVGAANDLAGLVNLSSPPDIDGVDAVALVPGVDEPKLFIVAEGDGPIPGMIQLIFDAASDPKDLVIFSGEAHGTDLFATHGNELTALLLDFLRSN